MDKITSFTIDHLKLLPGVYVSRKDRVGDQVITTFDIRMTRPNYEPVMNTAEVHTIEHLAATWLRNNDEWKDRVLYFGPMGCRTGFYLLDSPCLAAIATMAQQLQSRKWFWFAILYQNLFSYAVSLIVYQLGGLVLGAVAFNVWTIVAAVLLVLMLFMLFRPDPYKDQKSYTRSSVEAAS